MKLDARIDAGPSGSNGANAPDPWDTAWGICLPLDHVICRDIDGTPHTIRELIWPWSAYASGSTINLHFFYWNQATGKRALSRLDKETHSPERVSRMRELQFLITRPIYFGPENSPRNLARQLAALHLLARFAESRCCTVRDVLTQPALLDACGESMPGGYVAIWMGWLAFLGNLDAGSELGFELARPQRWKDLVRRTKEWRGSLKQYAPLPTRIYGCLITSLNAELDAIEAFKQPLLAALREALEEYPKAKAQQTTNRISIGPGLIDKYRLQPFLDRYELMGRSRLKDLSAAITGIQQVCKLSIHTFSGMRHDEARQLPYHCMVSEIGAHGRKHCLIAGNTTKFNKGRRLRTKWVTTESVGFRAIRLAQAFADVIYEGLGIKPSTREDRDACPLFPSADLLPWGLCEHRPGERVAAGRLELGVSSESLLNRFCPAITEEDIAELEEIDPFRTWRDEARFAIGQRWPLTTHQLRRSLALYANASGLVRISSLRRQLQHISREMSFYYGRGSTFCKDFLALDPDNYKTHIAVEWQSGEEEAQALAFVTDVLKCTEPMFGGAGMFYVRQRKRGEVMSLDEVKSRMKAGTLAYRDGPLGGCTRPGICDSRKGLTLIDTVCATDGCKHLVGKHSKIIKVIDLKRKSMAHMEPGSINYDMEQEDLKALERVEQQWRTAGASTGDSLGDGHG